MTFLVLDPFLWLLLNQYRHHLNMALDDMAPIHKVYQNIHLGIDMSLIFPQSHKHLHSYKHTMEKVQDRFQDTFQGKRAYYYSSLTRAFSKIIKYEYLKPMRMLD